MNFRELVLQNRSYRRFDEGHAVARETLHELVEAGRLVPSAGNLQPLKYILSADPERNARIFPCLRWAAYLKEWQGPIEGERPAAYIVITGDTAIARSFATDLGIAAQTVLLAAAEQGLGGCMIANIDRAALRAVLQLPERYELLLVIALGKPVETVVLETAPKDGDIKYWRSSDQVHHVPKRSLDEIILQE